MFFQFKGGPLDPKIWRGGKPLLGSGFSSPPFQHRLGAEPLRTPFFTSVFFCNVPLDKLRERNSFLPSSIEPWRVGWQRGDLHGESPIQKKSMEGFFLASLRGIGGARRRRVAFRQWRRRPEPRKARDAGECRPEFSQEMGW